MMTQIDVMEMMTYSTYLNATPTALSCCHTIGWLDTFLKYNIF